VTLKFLGEIEDAAAEKIAPAMKRAAAGSARFRMRLGGIGAFPDALRPRILWVGVTEGEAELTALAERLETELASAGFPKAERPFSAHITVGRSRDDAFTKKIAQALAGAAYESAGGFPVQKITLYKSTITNKGPIYEKVKEAPLA